MYKLYQNKKEREKHLHIIRIVGLLVESIIVQISNIQLSKKG